MLQATCVNTCRNRDSPKIIVKQKKKKGNYSAEFFQFLKFTNYFLMKFSDSNRLHPRVGAFLKL